MTMTKVPRTRRFVAILCAFGLLTLAGCGGRFKLVPVSGTVTVAGEPLTQFRLSFVPDTAKGNTTPVACQGRIDAQGRYELRTIAVKGSDGGAGAPPGWYKVVLVVGIQGDPEPNFDSKYTNVNTTPLSVEVVDQPQPGHYDLKLTRAGYVKPRPRSNPGSPMRRQQAEKQKNSGG
jgi:hypothetical protein